MNKNVKRVPLFSWEITVSLATSKHISRIDVLPINFFFLLRLNIEIDN